MKIDRRQFLGTVGTLTGGLVVGVKGEIQIADIAPPSTHADTVPLAVNINGQSYSFAIDPRISLLDLLRENLHLTGTKKGCDHGQCGSCTVLSNGRRINSCLSLAVVHEGDEITTVEGIAKDGDLHPIQQAFLEHDGLQCGYCTPGQICSAVALIAEARRGDASSVTPDVRRIGPIELTANEVRERMSGNICRCGAYPGIVAAVQAVARIEGGGAS